MRVYKGLDGHGYTLTDTHAEASTQLYGSNTFLKYQTTVMGVGAL